MPTQLAAPGSIEEIYLGRDGDLEPFRPILTGDVFRDITIPGVGIDHVFAAVVSHPCNMRGAAGQLLERIEMCPVTTYQDIPLDQWPDGHFKVFPLPSFGSGFKAAAVRFEETGMVPKGELQLGRRVASLTERGTLILLQRLIFRKSRADVALATLERACAHVLAEAELLEEWNETIVSRRAEIGEDLEDALAEEAQRFDEFLGTTPRIGEPSRRDSLTDQHRRPNVRREVRDELRRRLVDYQD